MGATANRLLGPALMVRLVVSGLFKLAVHGDAVAAPAAGGRAGHHHFEPGPFEER